MNKAVEGFASDYKDKITKDVAPIAYENNIQILAPSNSDYNKIRKLKSKIRHVFIVKQLTSYLYL